VSPSTCPPANYPGFATVPTAYGAGCPTAQPNGGNVYELFPSGTVDLSNTSLQFIALGPNQYLALNGPGFDNSFTAADIVPGQGDDTQVTVAVGAMGSFPFHGQAVSSIGVCSNGYLWMAPNPFNNAYVPSAADFASNSPRIAPLMHDWNFNAGGTFYWTTTPTSCMATWQNVGTFGVVGAQNTFQVKLFANGDIVFNYGTVLNNASTGGLALTGISFGNSPTNAGVDMTSFLTSATVIDLTLIIPLAHGATTSATLGQSYQVNMSSIPSGAGFGAFVFGVNQLSVDLTFLGMTGCTQYTSLDFSTLLPLSGPTAQFSLNVPFNPNFAGINLFSQAAVFAPLNPFGVIASNGLQAQLGL
jgi:hypothetical protein